MAEEESLLAGAEPTPSEESTETTTETTAESTDENTWFIAEGVPGTGEKPEWFKSDKYKTLTDQAKAYPDLESKFGGFTGAPDEYELSFPDGIEGEWIDGDPLMESFQTIAREQNMSQEAFTKILHTYVQNEYETMGTSREQELAALGDNAEKRLSSINTWSKANLDEEGYETLLAATGTAAGVKLIEQMIAKTRTPKIPTDDVDTSPGITHSEVKARMADPRYASDPDFRKETSRLYERLFGNEPKKTVVG